MPSKSPTVIDIVKSRVKDRVIFRVKGRVRDLEQTAKEVAALDCARQYHILAPPKSQYFTTPQSLSKAILGNPDPAKAIFVFFLEQPAHKQRTVNKPQTTQSAVSN